MEESLDIWIEAMRRLADAGNRDSTTEDLSIRMTAVDVEPQQSKKTERLFDPLLVNSNRPARKLFNMTIYRD